MAEGFTLKKSIEPDKLIPEFKNYFKLELKTKKDLIGKDYNGANFSSALTDDLGKITTYLMSLSKWLHSGDTGGPLQVLATNLSGQQGELSDDDIFKSCFSNGTLDASKAKEVIKSHLMKQVDRAFVWYFASFLSSNYFEGSANKNWAKETQSKQILGKLVNAIEGGESSEAFSHFAYLISGAGSKGANAAFKSSSVAGDFFESAINFRRDLFGKEDGVGVAIPTAREVWENLKDDPELKKKEAQNVEDLINASDKLKKAFASLNLKLFTDDEKNKGGAEWNSNNPKKMNTMSALYAYIDSLKSFRTLENAITKVTENIQFPTELSFLKGKDFINKALKVNPDSNDDFPGLKEIYDALVENSKTKKDGNGDQQAKEGDQQEDSSKLAPEADYDPLSDTNLPPEQRKQYLVQAYLKGEINGKEFARIDAAIQNSTSLYTTNIQQPVVQPMGVPVMGQPQMVMPGVVGV